jgi:hypothetical protein
VAEIDFAALSRGTGLAPKTLHAIVQVESRGAEAAIRFEPHRFLRLRPDLAGSIPYTPGVKPWIVPRSQSSEEAFDRAFDLDPAAAIRSTSFGAFQVMGWALLPEGQAGGPVRLLPDRVVALRAMIAFDTDPLAVSGRMLGRWLRASPGAIEAARALDWAEFARIYNGPGAAAEYAGLLADAYATSPLSAVV